MNPDDLAELLKVMAPAQWVALAKAMRQIQETTGHGQVSVEFKRKLPRHLQVTISGDMPVPGAPAAPLPEMGVGGRV